jgi:hypothetical protein
LVKKLKKKIKRDKKKKLELQSKELKNDKVSNFGKFLIYIFYIFLFMASVSRHLSINDRYRIYTSISEDLKMNSLRVPNSLEKINFYEIKTITDFDSWVMNFTGSFKEHRENERLKTLAKYNYHLSFLTGKFYYSKKPLDDIIIVSFTLQVVSLTLFVEGARPCVLEGSPQRQNGKK